MNKKHTNSKAKKVEDKKITFHGWDTTDEDEITRRKNRAATENIVIKKLDKDHNYFGSYLVYSTDWAKYDTAQYLVEIRSLNSHKNSCNCIDFQTNGLGTCKHIEKILLVLQKKGKRKFKQTAQNGSDKTEIYLDATNQNKITIDWQQKNLSKSTLHKSINKFFSTDNTLLGDPEISFPTLQATIKRLTETTSLLRGNTAKLRVSTHINPWLEKIQNEKKKELFRHTFTIDLKTGKRSLNILKYPLYDYQQEGMLHLVFNGRALLGDEMGLGKTIQAIAACNLLKQTKGILRVLVVATASLKAEWEEQIDKFSNLTTTVIHGPRHKRLQLYRQDSFFYLTNYEQIRYDGADIQRIIAPDVIILDEAQRIKNWQTKTAIAVKKLSSPYAFVLTGTPLENRIDDIYSIVQFLDPSLFGPLFRFNRQFYCLDEKGRPASYRNLDELHRKLKPILLRRKKTDVEDQLPERTVNNYFTHMESEQKDRYDEYSNKVAQLLYKTKQRPLRKEEFELLQKWLSCMRMLCDTPYILDQKCRISPKLHELEKILQELLIQKHTKILIFSEWTKMLQLIKELAQEMKIDFAWHTGDVPQHKRRKEINRFKEDPHCRLFLSSDSGSVGLNLQAANVVINVDLPWNPAKLEQRIARAWRKHQKNTVQVINLISENSIEHRMLTLLDQKTTLAENILHKGDAKEMEMPSGKAAFMERLEAIMNMSSRSTPSSNNKEENILPTKNILEQFQHDLADNLQGDLLKIERYNNLHGKSTLLAVTQNDISTTKQQLTNTLQKHSLDKLHDLVVIDEKTQDSINQLAKLGLITVNQTYEKIFESDQTTNLRKKQQQQNMRIQDAKKYLSENERQYRLATLLIDGGFYQEAKSPLLNTINILLTIYSYIKQKIEKLENTLPTLKLKSLLNEDQDFPSDLLDALTTIQYDSKSNEPKIREWLQTTTSLNCFVKEFLNKIVQT